MTRTLVEALQAGILAVAAAVAWTIWLQTRRRLAHEFWSLVAAGTTYLAVDEHLDVHESLGQALYRSGFREPPRINHVDDVVLLLMAAVATLVLCSSWDRLRRHGPALVPFVMAVALYGSAVVWDATASTKGSASWWFEESLELAGGLALAGSYVTRLSVAPVRAWRQSRALDTT